MIKMKGYKPVSLSLFVSLFILSLFFGPHTAFAADVAGVISNVEGQVDILRECRPPAVPGRMGEQVYVRDLVRTKSGAKAEITLSDGTILRIAQRSRIDISEYAAGSKGVVKLPRGKVQAVVPKSSAERIKSYKDANRFEIHTPNAVAGVRGTDFFVSHQLNSSMIIVKEGTVNVFNPSAPGRGLDVVAGQMTGITGPEAPRPPKPVSENEIMEHERDVSPEKKKDKAEGGSKGKNGQDAAGGERGQKTPPPPFAAQTLIGDGVIDTSSGGSTNGASSAGGSTNSSGFIRGFIGTGPIVPVSNLSVNTTITEVLPGAEVLTSDTTPPSITVSSSVKPASSGSSTAVLDFTSDETATFMYSIDGGAWTSSAEPSVSLSLEDGTHSVRCYAVDSWGNASAQQTVSLDVKGSELSGTASFSGNTASSAGSVAAIVGQNWGSWQIGMSGSSVSSPSSSGTSYAGGTASDSMNSLNGGYWLDTLKWTASSGTLSGTSNFVYLSYDSYGSGVGALSGSYDAGSWSLMDNGNGTYSDTPLTFVSEYTIPPGVINGILGGTGSLWTAGAATPTGLILLGEYTPSTTNSYHAWVNSLFSYNYSDYSYTTYDGGSYWGYIYGTDANNSRSEGLLALYVDPSGNVGYLSGSLSGSSYSDIGMFMETGTAYTISMGTVPGVSASTLNSQIKTADLTAGMTGNFALNNTSTNMGSSYGRDYTYYSESMKIDGCDWGIWYSTNSGSYAGLAMSDKWSSFMDSSSSSYISGIYTDGAKWSGNVLLGNSYGYYAVLSSGTPMTGIFVGETFGTFDPSKFTYQAVTTGVWLDTVKYLGMACPGGICNTSGSGLSADQTTLRNLNVPVVEVGRTNLSGSGNNLNVSMNDVIFFSTQSGVTPSLWVTGSVSGSYTAAPVIGTAVSLSNGSGLSATFTPHTWNIGANLWSASVSGSGTLSGGTYNGSITMQGAAAGSFNPSTATLGGGATGIAK